MKNVTITLDEETARWARVEAARLNTSVSRMLGELLLEKRQREEQSNLAAHRFFDRPARRLREKASAYPARDSLYDRTVLR